MLLDSSKLAFGPSNNKLELYYVIIFLGTATAHALIIKSTVGRR
jgi:hypothetical protein